ncbi:MAG: hypothetical protein RLY97_2 [Pseudomonadota bacterium]
MVVSRPGPQIYSIAAHRGFADALVAGLIPRYADPHLGLARLTLLLPNRRVVRTITEAFVRASDGTNGLLLPRMAVVGDLDLDETLGPLLDPLGTASDIPPAADPTYRWLRLAQHLTDLGDMRFASGAARLRQARLIGQTIDRLRAEEIDPLSLMSEDILGLIGDSAAHWQDSTRLFLRICAAWQMDLAARDEVDAPTRRNRLFDHAAQQWKADPPAFPIVAAGITSASPALARLCQVVAHLPNGAVILPDLDLNLADEVWAQLGRAGVGENPDDPPFGRDDALTHPQYHLKLLLNRMAIARDEVRPWHRAGMSAAAPARSKAISNLFLPPAASATWASLSGDQRKLAGVRLMECDNPGHEAQAIAILIREALEQSEKRVALITPNRPLATRVVAHLQRWDIAADDTAGRPLSQTAAGRVMLLLAEIMAEQAAPVPLVALLSHPLVGAGETRADWLDHARQLDLALRGPRPAAGLEPISALLSARAEKHARPALVAWWDAVATILAPVLALNATVEEPVLADLLTALASAASALCGEDRLWAGADGRALSSFIADLSAQAVPLGTRLAASDMPSFLRQEMDLIAVRPPWGGHPRVAIYGLLEARMSRADLTICGGLTEGSWPAAPAPDPLLPPAVLRHLGVAGADFRIGLSAHDLAGALGAPEVVLSWAKRDEAGPARPSRFVLRIAAMLGGDQAGKHIQPLTPIYARQIDIGHAVPAHPRPQPMPSAAQRKVDISATALDRLRSDPYQFYASHILKLSRPDALDATPTAAMQGSAAHLILDRWHKAGAAPAMLQAIAEEELDKMSAHALMRALWRPRLMAALEWIARQVTTQTRDEGRRVLDSERDGSMWVDGIKIHGRVDRIDALPDGKLAIVDYKTGKPPSAKMVQAGYTLQLGTLGLIAQAGGFADIAGAPEKFEYWSLAKKDDAFGFVSEPIRKNPDKGILREDFLPTAKRFLDDALARWINGQEAFTARLNPDIGGYNDYDQLMRLDEWLGALDRETAMTQP